MFGNKHDDSTDGLLPYRADFFHLVFALASMYIAMLFSNWQNPPRPQKDGRRRCVWGRAGSKIFVPIEMGSNNSCGLQLCCKDGDEPRKGVHEQQSASGHPPLKDRQSQGGSGQQGVKQPGNGECSSLPLPDAIVVSIFSRLDTRDLARAQAVCKQFRTLGALDAWANKQWRQRYTQRWQVVEACPTTPWATLFGAKMQQLRSWGGRYQQDHLHGHRCAVRAVKLLPSHNLLATGSLDKTVRLWDLQAGRPLAVSRPHGGTVRCLALDSFALASGCSDHIVRVWSSCLTPPASCASRRTLPHRATSCSSSSAKASGCSTDSPVAVTPSDVTSSDEDDSGPYRPIQPPGDLDEAGATTPGRQRLLFDVASAPVHCLTGHRGPVSALCLTPEALYSGSWDYTVRVWSREEGENGPGFQCVNVLGYDDWVGSVTARGGHLLVSAGVEVLVHDLGTGQVLRKFQNLHEGHVNCLEGSHSGRMLFTGSGDGLVLAHDLRMRDPTSVLWHFNAGVHSLALEDPWLACSAADGGVVLLNTEAALGRMPGGSQYRAGCRSSSRGPAAAWTPGSGAGGRGAGGRHSLGANCRQLAAAGGPAYSVDLVEQWLAAGSECTTVRVWDFTGAAEAAERAAIARAMRHSSKARRQASQMQRQQQQQQATTQAHYPTPRLPAAPQALRSDGHRQSLPLAQQQQGGGLAAMDPQLQHHLLPPPHRHHQLSSSPPLQSHPSTAVWAAQLSRHSLDSQGPRHSSKQAQYLPAHNPTRSAPAQPRQAWAMRVGGKHPSPAGFHITQPAHFLQPPQPAPPGRQSQAAAPGPPQPTPRPSLPSSQPPQPPTPAPSPLAPPQLPQHPASLPTPGAATTLLQTVSASNAMDKFKYRQVPRARNAKQRRQQRQQLEQQVQDC
ncbi:WD40-repeat-containing domain protein [Haematococcus lacustris]